MSAKEILRELRGALSQKKFAARLGVSQSYVCQMERKGRVGAQTALRIAERFRSEMDQMGAGVEDLLKRPKPRVRNGKQVAA